MRVTFLEHFSLGIIEVQLRESRSDEDCYIIVIWEKDVY